MSKKLLIISGPTATGKTALAIKLTKEFNGEIISADSRQLYIGMDIGTGKDHPKNTKINLIDVIKPNQVFSVAQYQRLAIKEITRIQAENKLPILVGGSGQYIDSIINPQPTFAIKPNNFLRFFLNKFSIKLLQKIYKLIDSKNYLLLNNSDLHNPHRLIRRIEIRLSPISLFPQRGIKGDFDFLHLSLTAPNQFLFNKIDQRIQKRLKLGLTNEINNLLKTYKWSDPGLKTIAYKEFFPVFTVGAELASALNLWATDEHNLVRRQKTWFKKIPNIIFIDITKPDFTDKIAILVKKWYNSL